MKAIENNPTHMDEHIVFGQQPDAAKAGDAMKTESAPFSNRNPHGEATIRVRVRHGVEKMQFEGEYISGGQEVDMPVSIALNAAQFVEAVKEDGTLGPVHAAVPETAKPFHAMEISGATHERVEKLETELAALDERRASVQRRLDAAKAQQESEIAERAKNAPPQNQPAAAGTDPVKTTETATAEQPTVTDDSVRPGKRK